MNTEKLETAGTDQAGGPPGKSPSGLNFPVIGIGASAGGIPALLRFFEHMPGDSGMAFVIVLHLSPKHESRADQILQRVTSMPVLQVLEPTPIEANTVYLISPSNELSMIDGFLSVTTANRPRGRPVAIDLFFRSLADDHRERAISIVMSGSGSDGALGIGRIKEQAGVAIVQSPDDAEYDEMPQNAIATGQVDLVLPVAAMPQKLIELWNNARAHPAARPRRRKPSGPRRERRRPRRAEQPALRDILATLRARTGHDFHHYKRATVLRRIERRLQVNVARGPARYRHFIDEHAEETTHLLQRHADRRDEFLSRPRRVRSARARHRAVDLRRQARRRAGPRLGRGLLDGRRSVFARDAACRSAAAAATRSPVLQVFATDIDESAINVARAAAYPDSIVTDVRPRGCGRFFTQDGRPLRARQAIARKGAVRHAQHPARSAVLAARPGVMPQSADLSGPRDPAPGAADVSLRAAARRAIFSSAVRSRRRSPTNSSRRSTRRTGSIARGARRRWAHRTACRPHGCTRAANVRPAAAAERGAIRSQPVACRAAPARARTSCAAERHHRSRRRDPAHVRRRGPVPALCRRRAVAQPAEARASGPAARTARGALPGRRSRAAKASTPDACSFKRGDTAYLVNMTVRPFATIPRAPMSCSSCSTRPRTTRRRARCKLKAHPATSAMRCSSSSKRNCIARRSSCSTTVEQSNVSNEELKASNEELQAINEELRSATEELETSKEELQSVNEELITVNSELQDKVEETDKANDDLQQPDRVHRHRDHVRRSRDAHQALYARGGGPLQPDRLGYRPAAARPHASPELSGTGRRTSAAAFEDLKPTQREVSSVDGDWFVSPRAALPHRRRPHRRRRADARRHQRAARSRTGRARERGAAQARGANARRITRSSCRTSMA